MCFQPFTIALHLKEISFKRDPFPHQEVESRPQSTKKMVTGIIEKILNNSTYHHQTHKLAKSNQSQIEKELPNKLLQRTAKGRR